MSAQKNKRVDLVHPAVRHIEDRSAHHYGRFPQAVFSRAEGTRLFDDNGKAYIDMLSAYSAVGVGNNHPRIKKVFEHSHPILGHAYYSVQEERFLKALTELIGMDAALLMNTGAEAVETALKLARKWAYTQKGVKQGKAEIIVADNNFHGRTITIVSFSTEDAYKDPFGPHTPGFHAVRYGDADMLEQFITPNTAAVLLEPIQGEGGVIVPPDDYLPRVRDICDRTNTLLILDEIQTGFGRTGKMFCFEHYGIRPDLLVVGKALGGGIYPVSGVLGSRELMDVFEPGEHGSTWGGNALACAIGEETLRIIQDEDLVERTERHGKLFRRKLSEISSLLIKDIRGKGLLIGVEFVPELGNADDLCGELLERGFVCKGAHETVLRLSPPLTTNIFDIEAFVDEFAKLLKEKEHLIAH